jgi:DNA polymerase-3 subunit alpha
MEREKAEELFRLIEPFSGYGFNKSHAASYGIVAYQTAYMKANYPVEFMGALLTAESNDSEKISAAVNECRRMKIKVLPPDINQSDVGFKIVKDKDSLEGRAIRFGLSAIKNVGVAAIEAILDARSNGRFLSFADFLSKVDSRRVNKKVLESMIKVGALSAFGSRAGLLFSIDEIRNKVSKPKASAGQEGLFSQDELRKSAETKISRVDSQQVSEFTQEEMQILERQLLGFSLSARPLGEIIGSLIHEASHKIYEISPQQTFGENVRIACIVTDVRIVVTRNSGMEMAFARAEDETGSIDLVIFPRIFKMTRNYWVDYKPLLISGRVDARDESPALIVESIETGETKDKQSPAQEQVFIRIPKETGTNDLKTLKNMLLANPGQTSVILVFEGEKRKITLPFRIAWNESLARNIQSILEFEQSS